ncbi:MAG: cation transporter [Anaerolineaceae bacterium]|nr:cation transporter [Anaerolineaceae bacterium]
MRWIRSFHPQEQLLKLYRRAMLITLAGNIFLGVIKSFAAYWSGSSAMYADAANSASDVIYSVLLVIGLWISQKPPDLSHPQGHSRFEPFVALIVTFSMAFAGFEAGHSSLVRFLKGGESISFGVPLVVLAVSIGAKATMFTLIRKVARTTSSPGLEAAAKDNISDVATSVAAALGILGSQFIHPLLDPAAGIFIALWIFKVVFDLVRENLGYLTGAGADSETKKKLLEAVKKIEGVEDVHHIVTEYVGPKLVIDMHINVNGEISLNQAHAICDQAIEVLTAFSEVDRAYVHVEPIGYL